MTDPLTDIKCSVVINFKESVSLCDPSDIFNGSEISNFNFRSSYVQFTYYKEGLLFIF